MAVEVHQQSIHGELGDESPDIQFRPRPLPWQPFVHLASDAMKFLQISKKHWIFVASFYPRAPILPLFMSDSWNHLLQVATEVVAETIHSLPDDLRSHALALAVHYEPVPSEALLEEGWEPDILGIYSGDPIHVPPSHLNPLPREIRLFLENLWNFTDGDEELYREEVRVTYLHELGHYLGLDEDDLEDRDLL